jgi:hypothetical protein
MTYLIKTITPKDSDSYQVIIRSDGAQIPMTEENHDYRVFLEWVAEGNTPGEWSEE